MASTSTVRTKNRATAIGVWGASLAACAAALFTFTFLQMVESGGQAESVRGTICLTYTDFVLDQHHQNRFNANQIQAAVAHAFDTPAGEGGAAEDASTDTMCGTPAEVLESTR